MELTVKLEDKADISFLKKMLLQLKGVKSVEISVDENFSWEEIESSPEFHAVMEQGREDIKNGKGVEMTPELMDSIFRYK